MLGLWAAIQLMLAWDIPACVLRVTPEYSSTGRRKTERGVGYWLFVDGSYDGIRTHMSRPDKIRSTAS